MKSVYNKRYYAEYDVGVDTVDYSTSPYTKDFLEGIAKRIVEDLQPKTVLDAGCAMGHLVAALRDLGVEAYGVDISEYAVTHAREDIREFCFQGSLAEPMPEGLPSHFDLVVSIEVLEHLYAEDGEKAIKNLCQMTDTIVFSSTPDDFEDPTHLNVQQREYWASIFAQNGFLDDLSYRPQYLTYHAACYRRREDVLRQIQDYERHLHLTEDMYRREKEKLSAIIQDQQNQITEADKAILEKKIEYDELVQAYAQKNEQQQIEIEQQKQIYAAKLEQKGIETRQYVRQCEELQLALKEKETECATLKERVDALQLHCDVATKERETYRNQYEETEKQREEYARHYTAAMEQRNALENQKNEYAHQLADVSSRYQEVLNCTCWKMTKPIRMVGTATKNVLKRNRITALLYKGSSSLVHEGPAVAWERVKAYMKKERPINTYVLTPEEVEKQRNTMFSKDIKFSILVPLYNTPEKFLREMIQSVKDQTYANWELCMADGSDKEHKDVRQICMEYRASDKRIKYKKLQKNLGISGNTNACIDMATGDYIALFDHDDLLHPAALYENMKAICEKDADFIYTDENTFHETPADAFCPHFKPDYAPDTLRANNYICHFTVFKRSLLEKAGVFRSECDGSQDFDMVLRLTEQAKSIVHIPKILYFWRAHKGSVAESVGAKPYVIQAAHKAVEDHLKRVGLDGSVLDSVVPSMYRLQYVIKNNPMVSILIPNKDHVDDLDRCLKSIQEKTTYENYEIIIIENNSEEIGTFDYYKSLEGNERIKIVKWKGKFNYSAINNFGFKSARGEHILLLNNDVEVISPDWLQEMIMYSQRSDVGAVGVKLFYPDHTIQHAGIGIGLLTLAGHYHRHFDGNHPGYMGRLVYAQNVSAVTAACVMIPRHVFEEVNGLDETFEVAFNDVDLCMRIRQAGYLIVFTPFAELYHYESKSRGLEDTPEKQKRFMGEVTRFQTRWAKELAMGDPYYNPNFSLDKEDFSIRA